MNNGKTITGIVESDEKLNELEAKVRKGIDSLSNEKLYEKYKEVTSGAQYYLDSLKKSSYIDELTKNKKDRIHYFAYTSAINTYNFIRKAIENGVKETRVRKHRQCVPVSTTDIFLETVNKIAIFEEYAKRF